MAFLWGIDKSPHISRCAQAHSSSHLLDRRYREVGARRVLCHQCDSVCDSLSRQFSIMRKLRSCSKVKYMTWLTAINTKKVFRCPKCSFPPDFTFLLTSELWHQYNHELTRCNVAMEMYSFLWDKCNCESSWFNRYLQESIESRADEPNLTVPHNRENQCLFEWLN